MNNFETFKDAVKHHSTTAKQYRKSTLWFDEYYCIFDNHFGTIKKTIGHSDLGGRVSLKEIEEFYAANKDEIALRIKRN